MADKTPFAKELRRLQYPDHCFLALLGSDGHFDPAFLKVKDPIRDLSLPENILVLLIIQYRFSSSHAGEKGYRVERWRCFAFHSGFLPDLYSHRRELGLTSIAGRLYSV